MKKIITISREFGAGGGEIGKEVARRLGYEYYDKQIVLRAAKESNLDIESLIKYDERVPYSFGFAQSLFEFYNRPLNEKLFEVQEKIVRELGDAGNCVIVGRNANAILREYDHCLHVFIHAGHYWRMMRMREQMPDLSEAKLSDTIRSVDLARKKYCAYYTDTEFGVSDYYDISLSSSKFGIEKCADIICSLV